MKSTIKQNSSGKDKSATIPFSPIPKRTCACGCGHEFQPLRRDQKYLSGNHADSAYNHTVRKEKNKIVLETEKKLRTNDKILAKYFKTGNGIEASCFLMNLQADGFDTSYYTGISGSSPNQFYVIYHYEFQCYQHLDELLIKIQKR